MSFWRGRPVLVTGGSGFIGANLVEALLGLGARVRVADNLERGRLDSLAAWLDRIEFVPADLLEREACREACEGIDTVFHLASRVGAISYYGEHPASVLAENCAIDAHVLMAAARGGVARYVYASSVFVYPAGLQRDPEAPALKEAQAYPADPPNAYGWAKLFGEKLLDCAVTEHPGLRGAALRLIGVYGPHQSFDLERGSILPVLVYRAIQYPQLGPFTIRGSGLETRSYCYVSDVVRAMLAAAEKLDGSRLLGPLNIGSETSIRIIDLAKEVVSLSGKEIEIVLTPAETAVWGQAVDCSEARRLLDGWAPAVPLRDGLRRVYGDIAARLAAPEQRTLHEVGVRPRRIPAP